MDVKSQVIEIIDELLYRTIYLVGNATCSINGNPEKHVHEHIYTLCH